jgi:hypothetical protein
MKNKARHKTSKASKKTTPHNHTCAMENKASLTSTKQSQPKNLNQNIKSPTRIIT